MSHSQKIYGRSFQWASSRKWHPLDILLSTSATRPRLLAALCLLWFLSVFSGKGPTSPWLLPGMYWHCICDMSSDIAVTSSIVLRCNQRFSIDRKWFLVNVIKHLSISRFSGFSSFSGFSGFCRFPDFPVFDYAKSGLSGFSGFSGFGVLEWIHARYQKIRTCG